MADQQTQRYTSQELELMKDHERRSGTKVIYTFAEKCEMYRRGTTQQLERTANGISLSLWARIDLDNDDVFDGPDDVWKTKTLEENLAAIEAVLKERRK